MMPLCACGCGVSLVANSAGKMPRFKHGHHRRGVKPSPETLLKMSISQTGLKRDSPSSEAVLNRNAAIKAAKQSPEAKERSRLAGIKARQTNPLTPERVEALQTSFQKWRDENPEADRARIEKTAIKAREAFSSGARKKRAWNDGLSEEQQTDARKKLSESKKSYWASLSEAEFSAEMGKRQMVTAPNKAEAKLSSLLPSNVSYVGDHRFWVRTPVGNKNPDFIVRPFKQTKKVIELYGDYWHKNHDPNDLISAYEQAGVTCLVVWEHELKDPSGLTRKIDAYIRGA